MSGQPQLLSFASRIDEFHEQAAAMVGYDNFGPEDGYYGNLETLLGYADSDAEWTALGRESIPQKIVGQLAGRLYAEKGFAEFPDCLKQPIEKPIIVVGLRSGTTAFHRLLSALPNTQALEFWLASFPMPRPPRETWKDIPAFQMVDGPLQQISQMIPDFHAMHSMSAAEADESHRADKTFSNPGQIDTLLSPEYLAWAYRQDQSKAYARYYKVLQLIGYNNRNKWVLKCPFHMAWIEQTLQSFPDATVVHTYRDPSEIIPSVCSITHTFLSPFQKLDKKQIGAFSLDFFAPLFERYVASQQKLRAQNHANSFYDVDYRDIITDPVACAKKVCIANGGEFSEAQEAAARQWHVDNRQGKHGKHEYSAEEFGLSREIIRERFRTYLDYYGL